MATINLGAIKFNWKGAYNSGTSYAVDDVVSSGGNSYVCIQAHSNQAVGNATAYWNIMSSAGTNGTDGTDLSTTLTTQGDLVYRDGSGLQRLGAGTSGQALITNGTGANPSWGDVSGGLIKSFEYINTTRYSLSGGADNALFSFTFNKQENATTSKVYVSGVIPIRGGASYFSGIYFDCLTSGVTSHNTNDSFCISRSCSILCI